MELLELYLSPLDDPTRFKVIVTQSPAGQGETESSLPFTDADRERRATLIRSLEVSSFAPQYFSAEGEQEWMMRVGILGSDRSTFHHNYLVNIGQALYQALFPRGSKVEALLQQSITLAESKSTKLVVRLTFEEDVVKRSRLADYPWELLHDRDFLCHHQVEFSRYIAARAVPPNLPTAEKLNVLLVSSAASDEELNLNPLSRKEQKAVRKGLETARDRGDIFLEQLEEPTFADLRTYLAEHRGDKAPHVLHFDGHGLFGKRCRNPECRAMNAGPKAQLCRKCNTELPPPQGYLVFEDEYRNPNYISAKELGTLLQQSSLSDGPSQAGGVVLVVLSACQSGMAIAGESVFNGAAQNMIAHRVPAVVAMQYSVRVDSATKFAEQFYRSLGQKNSLAVAVSQAREAMGVEGNQWYRPVLYLRWQDNEGGQLFASAITHRESERELQQILQEPTSPTSDYLSLVGILVDVSGSMTTSIRNRDDKVQNRFEGFRQSLHKVVVDNVKQISPMRLFALGFGFNNPISVFLRGDSGERVRDLLSLPNRSELTTTINQLSDDWDLYEKNIESMSKSMFGDTPMGEALRKVEDRLRVELSNHSYKDIILFILSDGLPTDVSAEEIISIIEGIKAKGIIVVSCYVTDKDVTKPRCIYGVCEKSWEEGAQLMFNCASLLKESRLSQYFKEYNWEIQEDGRLFAQINETELLEEFMNVINHT